MYIVYQIVKNWQPGPYNSLSHAVKRKYFGGFSLAWNKRKKHMFHLAREKEKIWRCPCWEKGLSWLANSNMVKPETFEHLHLVYKFKVP